MSYSAAGTTYRGFGRSMADIEGGGSQLNLAGPDDGKHGAKAARQAIGSPVRQWGWGRRRRPAQAGGREAVPSGSGKCWSVQHPAVVSARAARDGIGCCPRRCRHCWPAARAGTRALLHAATAAPAAALVLRCAALFTFLCARSPCGWGWGWTPRYSRWWGRCWRCWRW